MQNAENQKVGIREEQATGRLRTGFGRPGQASEVLILRQAPEMIEANPCEA